MADDSPGDSTYPADPERDVLGWEDGYWANETIDVDQSDGLDRAERRALVGRTMARVEVLRGLEFRERVPVEVVTRESFRSREGEASEGPRWRELLWEALFAVGEDRRVGDALDDVYGGAVLGYYSGSEDRIVLVADGERPVADRSTLAHELTHALQDQRLGGLGGGPPLDGRLAASGLVEGDAVTVEARYAARCGGAWDCVPRPNRTSVGRIDERNRGLYRTVVQPYVSGPPFVGALRERGGWAAVNDAHGAYPESTEQTVHPETYPDDGPSEVNVTDRSAASWERLDRTVTLGEAALYVALGEAGVVETSPYDYDANATDGWEGDSLVGYRSGDADGYVFRSRWERAADAREFAVAYRDLLNATGASRVGPGVYRVSDGPFADAFRVDRDGRTVTVVNAPTVRDLDAVHAA
jgi:hypothetical protein